MESTTYHSVANPRRLVDRLRDAIRRLHYSRRTEEAYIHWTKRFIYFHGKRHPAELGEVEVTAFLNHLATERNVAASTQNQALSALLLPHIPAFFRHALAASGLRHPHGAGVARSFRCQDHDDLHARSE